jgi:FHS family L-fucose permease-like MFS transporter
VQAFNSLGTTLAPIFGSALILKGATHSLTSPEALSAMSEAEKVAFRITKAAAIKGPYIFLSLSLFALALLVYLFRLPAGRAQGDPEKLQRTSSSFGLLLKHRHLALGAIGIFAYVGGEVSIGSFLINFLSDSQIGGISPADAAKYVSMYWGGAMVGRFIGSWALTRVAPPRILAFNGMMAALLVLTTLLSTGTVAAIPILSVGLFNSIMFPTIFTLAIRDLGVLTAQASGLLCMSIVGGAIVPLIQGIFADHFGIHRAFAIPFFCYCYIIYYSLGGYKIISHSKVLEET